MMKKTFTMQMCIRTNSMNMCCMFWCTKKD
nr:MAG TPA: hypothetical protein [Caudoviricetes sp.]DAS06282.1 MAG TPA: hypothetical protein [Caudoviricetes sp.]